MTKPLRDAVAQGHPWIYDRALAPTAGLAPGDVVTLVDERGPLATAMVDPGRPIAARVLDLDPAANIDEAWIVARCARAARDRVRDPLLVGCDGLRWIHGENDGCPGLVVDGYAGVFVVVFDGGGAARLWEPQLAAVLEGLRQGGAPIETVWVRAVRGGAAGASGHAVGAEPPALVTIRERDARFEVDVRAGQKTGFFLDQRQNRLLVGGLAAGADVLNVFSYSGGFSVHAGLGGARSVTSVDIAGPAIEAARRNVAASGLDPAGHAFVAEDAFEFFARAVDQGRRWDLVITDPPSFAPSEQARPKALAAYRRIAHTALGVVAPGGLLAFASCSSHVTEADLLGVLASAGGGALRVRAILGAASDHPVLPAFPEGRYLKFILASTA
ncbi:MAG: class I SAM-dependent rRNA methyltransferase [Kofleriaceae bacterium]